MRSASISELVSCSKAAISTDPLSCCCAVVSRIRPELARPEGHDGRTWHQRRPLHDPPLGRSFLAGAIGALQSTEAGHRWQVASGIWTRRISRFVASGCTRAIDSAGDTVEFWFSEHRDLPAAKRFMRRALARHGRPDRIVIDGSRTNREAIISCDAEDRLRDRSRRALKAFRIRSSKYLNNRIEQDHRRIKRRVRPMLGFKAFSSATVTLAGIEMVHMMRRRQGRFAFNPAPSLKEQFEIIAA